MPLTDDDARGGASQAEGTYDYDAPYALGEQDAEVLWAEENYSDKSHLVRLGLRGHLSDGFAVYGGGVADAVGRKVDYYVPKRGQRVGEILDAFRHLARADGLHLPDVTGHPCRVVVEEEADDRRGGFRPRVTSVRPAGTRPAAAPAPAPRPAAPTTVAGQVDEADDAYDFGI